MDPASTAQAMKASEGCEMIIKSAFAAMVAVATTGPVMAADDIVLTTGALRAGGYGTKQQPVSVENKTSRLLENVTVECGFYDAEGKMVGAANAYIRNLAPSAVGHDQLQSSEKTTTSAKCRISDVRPAK